MPTVGLFTHRTVIRGATGVGFYVRRFTSAVSRLPPADGLQLRILAPNEEDAAGPGEESLVSEAEGLPLVRAGGRRRPLYLAWSATGRPRMDRRFGYPDLVHILFPSTPVPVRAPSLYTVHDLMPLTSPQWYTRSERWAFERGIRYAARRAERLLANSRTTADEVVRRLDVKPERVAVVYHGVDDAFFRPVPTAAVRGACASQGVEPGRYLVAVGSVSRRKAITTVLEAMADPELVSRDVRLLAVGPPGEGYDSIVDTARALGVAHRVRFAGWQPTDAAAALLAGATALVHPSLDEGFGITPLEAMAVGVPTVVSDSGSLPEVTAGASLVVAAGRPDEWAAAVARLVDDGTLRQELVRKGAERAARFRWDRTAAESVAIYREILGCG